DPTHRTASFPVGAWPRDSTRGSLVDGRALACDEVARSAFGRRGEQRDDVLSHPRATDLVLDPLLGLGVGEAEEEKGMRRIDLDESALAAGLLDGTRSILRRRDQRFGDRLGEREV